MFCEKARLLHTKHPPPQSAGAITLFFYYFYYAFTRRMFSIIQGF